MFFLETMRWGWEGFWFKGLILFLLSPAPMNCHNVAVFTQHSQQAHCEHVSDTGTAQSKGGYI